MLAVLSVKLFPFSPILSVPVAASCAFRYIVGRRFARPLDHLSAHAAADLDRADAVSGRADGLPPHAHSSPPPHLCPPVQNHPALTPEDEAIILREMDCENAPLGPPSRLFLHPAFKVLDGHEDTLRELREMRERVRAANDGLSSAPSTSGGDARVTNEPPEDDALACSKA